MGKIEQGAPYMLLESWIDFCAMPKDVEHAHMGSSAHCLVAVSILAQ